MSVQLRKEQLDTIDKMKNGCILCAGVGLGKSRTALAYYLLKSCDGGVKINGVGSYLEMKSPKDLYIITTAKKRDSTEWVKECQPFMLTTDPETSHSHVLVKIDSWNNIKKYQDVKNAFFIFDEQRVVGYGAWTKSFLKITKSNEWILLSATPGDQWSDYIPVFIANGFYKNKTEFAIRHIVYNRFAKYPQIDRYINEGYLRKCRKEILVNMDDTRHTERINIDIPVAYNIGMYRTVLRDRWDPFESKPIQETGKLCYLLRRVVNSHADRIEAVSNIFEEHPKLIIFYSFDYELEMLKEWCEQNGITYGEWNGHNHDALPEGEEWVYIVQYIAGSEGWNCISTDTMVFFSQSYSYRQTEQAAGRIDRINTPYNKLYYYHLRSTASIDLAIKRSLTKKEEFNQQRFVKSIKE